MSFWRTFGFHTVSPIDTILERDHYTLEELLDEDDLLSECKSQNKKLIEFLLEPQVLDQLFDYLLKPAEDDANQNRRLKYPYLACEILSMEVWDITDAIYENSKYLDALWDFLYRPELDPLLCTYTTQVAGVLLQRKIRPTLDYLQKKDHVVDKFITHLNNSAVLELLLRVIACEEAEPGVLTWLSSENLIEKIIAKFDPKQPASVHENAAQALIEIIDQTEGSQDSHESPLIDEIEKAGNTETLFGYVVSADSPRSVVLNGLSVVSKLLERRAALLSTTDKDTTLDKLPDLFQVALKHTAFFVSSLKSPAAESPKTLITSFGQEIVPVGPVRLAIVGYFSSLLQQRFACIDDHLLKEGVFNACINLFFSNYWNNFLHYTVSDIIKTIFYGNNIPIKVALIKEAKLSHQLVDAAQANIEVVKKEKGVSRGYMGFVTDLSNLLVETSKDDPEVNDLLSNNDEWTKYTQTILEETNKVQNSDLAGPKPISDDTSSDDISDTGDSQSQLVSVFTQYLAKQGFSGGFPTSFDDDPDDELDDDDDEDDQDSNNKLVLDSGFESGNEPYSADIRTGPYGDDDDESGETLSSDDDSSSDDAGAPASQQAMPPSSSDDDDDDSDDANQDADFDDDDDAAAELLTTTTDEQTTPPPQDDPDANDDDTA
mmetsp:Transcript_15253/g.22828  ORF Transcript_15253/g.22828 Transcript_15253/m.22828 type:complete len:659 (+) Transcript_15253:40-2016(+)|eukprot:CAMPEP_0201550898 /NCGR_PEP_ID=MMETSP0173_2-20130828/7183_1 /ASSEMBLY_ACC=CAM_ASM_000268 /TAXON_ID=218659 /ORGANISM="Vexillifera sp., Strain DIVA3 564/2" /LENGTH=658 /DNA_ID=CAMNT_0047961011 /DNA_START=34 /DNA_END=2010 /DNA_ORIENTATION=+